MKGQERVTLEDYEPIGHHILLKLTVKGETESGIILDKKKADKWMEVAKVGSLVTSVEPGDLVIMAEPRGLIHLSFGTDQYMQVYEHDIAGKAKLGKKIENQLNLDIA